MGVADLAGGPDAGDAGAHVPVDDEIALLVGGELVPEEPGVGDVADKDKDAVDGQVARRAGLDVAQADGGDAVLTLDAVDDGVPDKVDARVFAGAALEGGPGAELVAAVDDGDTGGESGEKEGLLEGAVAAADDGDVFVAEEPAVAGGAIADAAAGELGLAGDAELAGGGAGGDDEGFGLVDAAVGGDGEGAVAEVDGGHQVHLKDGAKALGVFLQALDELGAGEPFGKAGIVVDLPGEGHLTADLVAGKDEGAAVGAAGVEG